MTSKEHAAVYLKDYLPPNFLIDTVHLHFDVNDEYTEVVSILHIKRNPEVKKNDSSLCLMGDSLELKAVILDGKKLDANSYEATPDKLIINSAPNNFVLETKVVIYPAKNTQLMGLYQSRNNLCTQCESEGFRRITYFLDRPDVMSKFTVTIAADREKYPYLLSNGNLIEEKILESGKRWVHWEDPSKKPCYLFALVAGDFDVIKDIFKTMSGRTVDLVLYLEKGFLDQGAYAMASLKNAMRWDEEKFGREYDLDRYMIVAVSDFNMGAMENKGLNIFNTKYVLAKPETATDEDCINIEAVIGHEYFHNWTGNRITCREWFELTLKEGLTVLRDQLFTEDMTSYGVARINAVNTLRNQQFPEDASQLAHPIRPESYMKIDNFYTMTIYYKGAEVIRMIRTMLTPEIFRKGMDLYFETYDGQAVTTDEFVGAMEKASGKDLTQFKNWYNQAGTPKLTVSSKYNEQAKTYTLKVKQRCNPTPGQSEKMPFHLPLVVGLVGKNCEDLPLHIEESATVDGASAILELKEHEQTFVFTNVNEKPVPSLLRHFSAPVELNYDYTDEELALLFQCDSDPFARWEAGQRFAIRVVESVAEDIKAARTPVPHPLYLKSFIKIIKEKVSDEKFVATLLQLPSLKYLLSNLPHIELDVIYAARNFVERIIAANLKEEWVALFDYLYEQDEPYVYEQKSVGRRALRNRCLYYLLLSAEMRENEYFDWALMQVRRADNMTDKLSALAALNNHPTEHRQLALDDFFEMYKHEPLVVNKWLSIQASTVLSSALDDVKRLMKNPVFDIKNPNNVYALLVAFGENTIRFHDPSGQSYKFIADQTLLLDTMNPQVASRVIQPLTRWDHMDESRSAFMRAELERIASHKNLSENVYELVTKSLGS